MKVLLVKRLESFKPLQSKKKGQELRLTEVLKVPENGLLDIIGCWESCIPNEGKVKSKEIRFQIYYKPIESYAFKVYKRDIVAYKVWKRSPRYDLIMEKLHIKNEGPKSKDQKVISLLILIKIWKRSPWVYQMIEKLPTK